MLGRTSMIILLLIVVLGAAWYFNMQRGTASFDDGTYTGESQPDDNQQYGQVKLTVENGKIKSADYKEFDGTGNPKDSSYPYQLALQAFDEFEKRLVETQDPEKVDNVTGATGSWGKFKEAANAAINQAK